MHGHAERAQRFGDRDAGGEAEPAEAREPAGIATREREVEVRGQRRTPCAPAPSAPAALAFDQQRLRAIGDAFAAQQHAVAGIDDPFDVERGQQGARRFSEPRADRVGVEQVAGRAQGVTAAGLRVDADAGFAQGFHALVHRAAADAEPRGQRLARRRARGEHGEQVAVVHGWNGGKRIGQ